MQQRRARALLFALIVIAEISPQLGAQDRSAEEAQGGGVRTALALLARSYGDSVVLRWAPASPVLWSLANTKGYMLTRLTVSGASGEPSDLQALTADPIRPWTLEEWKARARRDDTLAAVAAQMLYGKRVRTAPESLNFDDIATQKAEEENRFSYAIIGADLNPLVAEGLGLRWVDRHVDRKHSYVYFLHSLVGPGIADTAMAFVDMRDEVLPPSLPEVSVDELDRAVRFRWPADASRRWFSAFTLERSDDGGATYHRTHRSPIAQSAWKEGGDEQQMVVLDSLPVNYRRYFYRITGITPFGEAGKSAGPLLAMGRDRTPPLPVEDLRAVNTRGREVLLSWKKPAPEQDLAGYLVGRGETFAGPFIPLFFTPLGKGAAAFTDTGAAAGGTNYYVVSAIDTAGNAAASIPAYAVMIDTIPPARPGGLAGAIDTAGVARLSWNKGAEGDLEGYLLLFANSRHDAFAPVTGGFIADTSYRDTVAVNTLTPNVFYTLVAYDRNRNPSKPSDTLALRRPDRIPPVSPVFSGYLVSDSSIALEWIPSSSADVDSQFLYRRSGEEQWRWLRGFGADARRFVDTAVTRTVWYEYTLAAMDQSRQLSERSFPVRVRVYDSGLRPPIQGFRSQLPEGKGTVVLRWNGIDERECRVVVYRSSEGSPPVMFGSAPAGDGKFEDAAVDRGSSYTYSARARYGDAGQSPLTQSLTVRIPK